MPEPAATLVFDLDGTLSDPIVGIAESVGRATEACGLPPVDRATLEQWIGPPLDQMLVAVTGQDDPGLVRRLVTAYRERYAERGWAECEQYPGVADALDELGAAGVDMAVCTSKRVDFARQVLELHGTAHHFRLVSGGDVGVPKSAQLAELLAEGAIGPGSVMVGDRAVDLAAAGANGLRGVGVLWGYGSRAELEAEGPVRILARTGELASLGELVGDPGPRHRG